MSLNEHQEAHLEYINSLPDDQRCGCGWFSSNDCKRVCPHPHNSKPLDTAHRDGYKEGRQRERERCVKIINDLRKAWGSAGPTDQKVIYARNALSSALSSIIDNGRV